jgi:hypothetical protein
MRWIRRNTRSHAWLALFALAMQLVVSFGHMHRGDLGVASSSAGIAVASQLKSDLTSSPAVPADHDRNSAPDDFCPICASISLAAALIMPLAPRLDAALHEGRVQLSDASTSRHSSQIQLSFQARAPPVA